MLKIGNRTVSPSNEPFIIAELSGNHGGSLERALRIVDAVADAGAHALKLQTYTADTMTLDLDDDRFRVSDNTSPWAGRRLHDLYAEAHTPWDWHEPIFERAREHGLIAFSSPFDATAVEFLESLNVPCYKVASFEITDLPLIEAIARTGKPMIISTGMSTMSEIDTALATARRAGCDELAVLKCTSLYPAPPSASNLAVIPHLRQWVQGEVGLSDHTLGIGVAVAAVAMGATLIEKHVTDDRNDPTVDSAFSLEPTELAQLVTESRSAWESQGVVAYGPAPAEEASLHFRRSLFFVRNLPAGTRVGTEDVRVLRPNLGLPPAKLDVVVGMTVTQDVQSGDPVSWDVFG